METIYLIIAEGYPKQLLKLVESLDASYSIFVIHVDKGQSLQSFSSVLTAYKRKRKVYFVKDRLATTPGGFNLVRATLKGLNFIYKRFIQTSRVVLLNGQDYPIKSKEYINSYFNSKPNQIFIQHSSIQNNKLANYKPSDASFGISFPVWTIKTIIEFVKNNPEFLSNFKNGTLSNESFFQILLLNCKTTHITNNIINHNLRLTKWDKSHLHKKILNGQDIDLIIGDDSLFATKFDPEQSFDLLLFLDNNILKLKKKGDNNSNIIIDKIPFSQITKQNVILLLTDSWRKGDSKSYDKLIKASSSNKDVHLIYHNTGKRMPRSLKKLDPFVFDNSILNRLGYKPISSSLVPGSNHFPLLKFYWKNPHYEFYWNIENDVRYNGEWEEFFGFFTREKVSSDFLSCNINDYKDQPDWYWWNTIGHPFKQIPQYSKVRSFNPIFRISNQALKFLHEELSEGWSGHHEVLIPTLLKNAGFSINDFGGTGKYVLPECESKFYISPLNDEDLDSGTMRFRPFICKEEINEKLLYHPVKFKD